MNLIDRNILKTWALCLSLSMLAAAPAQSQDRKIEQAIKHRRAAFTLMSTYFSRLLQIVEGDRPFDARMVEVISRLPWEGFAPGTERGDTKAKEDIWFEEDRFKKLGLELEGKTTLLAKAAETGDIKRIKAAFESARDTCSACHKAFRKT